jgi:hypothetical protein
MSTSQKTHTDDPTRIAEILISLRRILQITGAYTDGDAEQLGLIEYEAQHALKAAQSLSEPALVS